ncbi:hypothetical protein HMPREF0308_0505 [Corynebacterium striatum ATCC 6940]|nr:hypothetical protein HMPREF0308_0505 [Corynebacterium striatum ATCC 6940]
MHIGDGLKIKNQWPMMGGPIPPPKDLSAPFGKNHPIILV